MSAAGWWSPPPAHRSAWRKPRFRPPGGRQRLARGCRPCTARLRRRAGQTARTGSSVSYGSLDGRVRYAASSSMMSAHRWCPSTRSSSGRGVVVRSAYPGDVKVPRPRDGDRRPSGAAGTAMSGPGPGLTGTRGMRRLSPASPGWTRPFPMALAGVGGSVLWRPPASARRDTAAVPSNGASASGSNTGQRTSRCHPDHHRPREDGHRNHRSQRHLRHHHRQGRGYRDHGGHRVRADRERRLAFGHSRRGGTGRGGERRPACRRPAGVRQGCRVGAGCGFGRTVPGWCAGCRVAAARCVWPWSCSPCRR